MKSQLCEPFSCFLHIFEIRDRNLPLQEGFVLVDTAAGHPTCGGSYFDALERVLNKQGVNCVVISVDKASIPTKARGVGGIASTKEIRLIPMRLGNVKACEELLVLKNEVPPLLSVTLLEHCVIDLQRNILTWNLRGRASCESVMYSLNSKHRAVHVSIFMVWNLLCQRECCRSTG